MAKDKAIETSDQPADPGAGAESLADFQKRRNAEAGKVAGGQDGDALVVEPPTLKSVVGYSDEKKALLAGTPKPPMPSRKKGK